MDNGNVGQINSLPNGSGINAKENDNSNNNFQYGANASQLDNKMVQQNEFNLDRSEYKQVFNVFDKSNSEIITIQQVYELINKFDAASTQSGGSNLYSYQSQNSGPGAGQGGAGAYRGNRGQYNQIGNNKAHANMAHGQGGGSSQLYSNGQYIVGNKDHRKHGLGTSGGTNSGIGNKGGSINGQVTDVDDSKRMYNQNGSISSNNNQSINNQSVWNGQNINREGVQASLYPLKLNTKNKQISQTTPGQGQSNNQSATGGNNNSNYNNNKNSPRRSHHHNNVQNIASLHGSSKSDGNEAQMQDDSPGIGMKHGKIKPGMPGNSSYNQLSGQNNNSQQITSSSTPTVMEFPNGKDSLQFDEFIEVIRESCSDNQMAENYLVLAFSMFDRQKKGYISRDDLKQVFEILGESITDEEVNTMVKIAGIEQECAKHTKAGLIKQNFPTAIENNVSQLLMNQMKPYSDSRLPFIFAF